MVLNHPFVIYGFVFNTFTTEYIPYAEVEITFPNSAKTITVTADEDGFYLIDIQNHADDGEYLTFKCLYEYWGAHHAYTVNENDLSKELQINLNIELSNLLIYYGDGEDEFISCWANEWYYRNQDFVLVTTLNKSQMETIKSNCRPGAFISRKVLGYGYMVFDSTWSNDNTLRFVPFDMLKNKLSDLRKEEVGCVKNLSISPMPNHKNKFIVRIDCIIKNT